MTVCRDGPGSTRKTFQRSPGREKTLETIMADNTADTVKKTVETATATVKANAEKAQASFQAMTRFGSM